MAETIRVQTLRVPVWAYVLLAVAATLLLAMTMANGAAAQTLHEFLHDGRHILGVPCH